MISSQIEYLFSLCMKLQEKKDGYCEKRQNEYVKKPTVFFDFYGHVARLEINVYKEGWTPESDRDEPFKNFSFDLSKEIDKNEFEKCKNYLLELIKEQEVKK